MNIDNRNSQKSLLNSNINDPDSWTHAPRVDWSSMSDTEHLVQFYEADGFLLNSLSAFVGSALTSDGAAVVVATEEHRRGRIQLLSANWIYLNKATASGKYVALDAAATLSKFMFDGVPVTDRFNDVVGSVMASVTDGRS